MIVPRKIYTHDGLLVHDDIAPYGIFVYHDVGEAAGYKPWNKLRIAEVLYLKKQKRWFFATRKIRGKMKESSVGHSVVGVPDSLREDFLEAIRRLEIEHGNFKAREMGVLKKMDLGNPEELLPPVCGPLAPETEEEEVDRLLHEIEKGATRNRGKK